MKRVGHQVDKPCGDFWRYRASATAKTSVHLTSPSNIADLILVARSDIPLAPLLDYDTWHPCSNSLRNYPVFGATNNWVGFAS